MDFSAPSEAALVYALKPAAISQIAEAADEIGADLVVIGTHGRGGLAHMLLGSAAEQVLRSTSCPVLTVRPNAFRFELP